MGIGIKGILREYEVGQDVISSCARNDFGAIKFEDICENRKD